MCCDGQSALSRCFSEGIDTNSPHWDIIMAAITERQNSPIKWHRHHVKGHQDIYPLERDAMLNEEMDSRCKQFWEEGPKTLHWFHQPWTVTINRQQVVSDLNATIRSYCSDLRVERYWESKMGANQEEIDWVVIGRAVRSVKRAHSQWLTKHLSGFCSVGSFAKKIGLRPTDECPRCGETETTEHVWRCTQSKVTEMWNFQLAALQRLLRQLQTDPRIIKVIIEGLKGWRNGEEKIYNSRFAAEKVADNQTALGWKHFFEGRHHKQWRLLQEQYFLQMSIHRSGKRWSGAIIKKLWEIAWDLWEHRNGIMHGKECALLSDGLDKQIEELWHDPDRTKIQTIRKLGQSTLAALLQSPSSTKQNWVIRVKMALQRYKENQGESIYASERKRMQRYLDGFKK
jgi:hypothetical protein